MNVYGSVLSDALNSPFTVGVIALIGVWLQGRRTRKEVRERVGTPNGQGNVVQMLERAHARMDDMESRQYGFDGKLNRTLSRLGRIEAKQRTQEQLNHETLDRVCQLEGGTDCGEDA